MVLAAGEATSQHPVLPLPRPLDARVELSDVITLGEVTAVAPDRLRVRRPGPALLGTAPEEFEVKISSGERGLYEVGDLETFFLRGARSPYVHADEIRERIRPEEPGATRRLAAALVDFVAAREDPERMLALHLEWLAAPDAVLQQLAVRAFLLGKPPFGPLPPERARELARAAMDPERPLPERRAVALVATTREAGLEALLAAVPGAPPASDAAITERALHSGSAERAPGTQDAIRRTLAHPDPELRLVGLRIVERRGAPGATREAVAKLAEDDPDPETRQLARRALERLNRMR